MNNLSWFLYLANVLPSIGGVFIFFGCVALCFALVWFLVRLADLSDNGRDIATTPPLDTRLVFVGLLILILGVAVPSEKTIYLIAGSEVGEMAIQSEEAKEIYGDIRRVIQSYSAEETSK
jgi:hypothetical protein